MVWKLESVVHLSPIHIEHDTYFDTLDTWLVVRLLIEVTILLHWSWLNGQGLDEPFMSCLWTISVNLWCCWWCLLDILHICARLLILWLGDKAKIQGKTLPKFSDEIKDKDCLWMTKRLGLLPLSRLSYYYGTIRVGWLTKTIPHFGYPIFPTRVSICKSIKLVLFPKPLND